MEKCWANPIGGCSNKISGEHYISKSVFINKFISVKGFSWCRNDFKKVGLSRLKINALCKYHNSSLSPLDDEAKRFTETLRRFEKINSIRNTKNPRNPVLKEYEINGKLLERWFLKTLINISYNDKLPIGEKSNIPGKPSKRIVNIVFGEEEFKRHEGLYVLKNQNFIIRGGESYKVSGVFNGDKCVIGGLFEFRGLHFFLSIKNVHVFDFLKQADTKENPLKGSIPVQHLENLEALTKSKILSQRIIFKW